MGHRPSTGLTVGEMLYDDFEPFKESKGELLSVYASEDSSRLNLNLTCGDLTFFANADDDTLIWCDGQRDTSGLDITGSEPWVDFLGKKLEFAWLMMNDQGYIDGALIGFDNFFPEIALNVVASTIKVSRCGPWSNVASA
jgi:Family of unknown function (DUF6334)